MHFCVLGFDIAGAGPGLRGGLAGGLAGGWGSSAGLAVGLPGSSQALLSGKGALFSQAAPPSLPRWGWAPSSRLKASVSEYASIGGTWGSDLEARRVDPDWPPASACPPRGGPSRSGSRSEES